MEGLPNIARIGFKAHSQWLGKSSQRLKFLDLNTFYGPKAGGIRTYHQAKMEWFSQQARHEYILAYPGPMQTSLVTSQNVRQVTLPGPALTSDPDGYRLLWNPLAIARLLEKENPDVIEVGDPWMTGPMVLALHRFGHFKGVFSHFYHSDPIPSYLDPWARQGRGQFMKSWAAALGGMAFYRMQKKYPLTVTSSRVMQKSLQRQGIPNVAFLPFGVGDGFFAAGAKRSNRESSAISSNRPLRVLYAGRLDPEKGWDILLPLLPKLLDQGAMEITIAGRGRYADTLAQMRHERFRYVGFVQDRSAMEELYANADVLLAPGPFETFGLGVLEAMASGLPVVGPDQGGSGELLLDAQSPLCFKAHSAPALWHTLLTCLELAKQGKLIGIAHSQREVALRYGTWKEAMSRLMAHYESRLESGARF
jgi:alpha-1,6-mannosyltransferase